MIATIFHNYGLKFDTAVRTGGWTNAVWYNQDIVLRLSLTEHSDKIRKELQLSKLLSDKIGYPKNIAQGVAHQRLSYFAVHPIGYFSQILELKNITTSGTLCEPLVVNKIALR